MLSSGKVERLDLQGSLLMEIKNPDLKRPVINFENSDKKIGLRLSPTFNKSSFQIGTI